MNSTLITALQDCVKVMERDLNGLAVIQPELKQAREALASLTTAPEWTGEGLPPVGIECERCWCSISGTYHRIKVLGHDGNRAIFRWLDGKRAGELQEDRPHSFSNGRPCFRPIRTPEQIAAEEREKAAKDMATLMTGHENHQGEWGCYVILGEILYDAGYRKVEGGEQ